MTEEKKPSAAVVRVAQALRDWEQNIGDVRTLSRAISDTADAEIQPLIEALSSSLSDEPNWKLIASALDHARGDE
jgi:hypothetical protein